MTQVHDWIRRPYLPPPRSSSHFNSLVVYLWCILQILIIILNSSVSSSSSPTEGFHPRPTWHASGNQQKKSNVPSPPKVVVFPLVKPTPLLALSGRLLVNSLYLTTGLYSCRTSTQNVQNVQNFFSFALTEGRPPGQRTSLSHAASRQKKMMRRCITIYNHSDLKFDSLVSNLILIRFIFLNLNFIALLNF